MLGAIAQTGLYRVYAPRVFRACVVPPFSKEVASSKQPPSWHGAMRVNSLSHVTHVIYSHVKGATPNTLAKSWELQIGLSSDSAGCSQQEGTRLYGIQSR